MPQQIIVFSFFFLIYFYSCTVLFRQILFIFRIAIFTENLFMPMILILRFVFESHKIFFEVLEKNKIILRFRLFAFLVDFILFFFVFQNKSTLIFFLRIQMILFVVYQRNVWKQKKTNLNPF